MTSSNKLHISFWFACLSELLMAISYFGLIGLLAIYLVSPIEQHGLGFSQNQKALFQSISTAIVFILPLFSGALADTIGHRKVSIFGSIAMCLGAIILRFSSSPEESISGIFIASIGWGAYSPVMMAYINFISNKNNNYKALAIFWVLRNIGGITGTILATHLSKESWLDVFDLSIFMGGISITALFVLIRPPKKDSTNYNLKKKILISLVNAIRTFKDPLYLRFLIFIFFVNIFTFQFFDSILNFVSQWVDSRPYFNWIHSFSPFFAEYIGTKNQAIPASFYPEIDTGMVVCFQILVSYLLRRFKVINIIYLGSLVRGLGILLTFATLNPLFAILGIFIYSIGDVISAPKVIEFIHQIAGSSKSGAYIGGYFLAQGIAGLLSGIVSGPLFNVFGNKYHFLKLEAAARSIEIPLIGSGHSGYDAFINFANKIGMEPEELTKFLWEKYDPWRMVFIIGGLIIVALLAGISLNRFTKKRVMNDSHS